MDMYMEKEQFTSKPRRNKKPEQKRKEKSTFLFPPETNKILHYFPDTEKRIALPLKTNTTHRCLVINEEEETHGEFSLLNKPKKDDDARHRS
jgi:hypothetical protein